MAKKPAADSFAKQWQWVSWVLMGIIAVAVLAVAVLDDDAAPSQGERVSVLASTILCPQCAGQTVAESNVAISRSIRADIAARISEGQSDDEIRQAYIDNYGEWIITTPASTGFASLVWIVPVIAAGLSTAALGLAFMRWRRALGTSGSGRETTATDEDEALVASARATRSAGSGDTGLGDTGLGDTA